MSHKRIKIDLPQRCVAIVLRFVQGVDLPQAPKRTLEVVYHGARHERVRPIGTNAGPEVDVMIHRRWLRRCCICSLFRVIVCEVRLLWRRPNQRDFSTGCRDLVPGCSRSACRDSCSAGRTVKSLFRAWLRLLGLEWCRGRRGFSPRRKLLLGSEEHARKSSSCSSLQGDGVLHGRR